MHWEHGQQTLNKRAGSLEEFAVYIVGSGEESLPRFSRAAKIGLTDSHLQDTSNCQDQLQFQENMSLRSIVLRTPSHGLFRPVMASLWRRFSAITSPALSEFVLELGGPPFRFIQPSLCGDWDEIDKLLKGFLDWRPDFKQSSGRAYRST